MSQNFKFFTTRNLFGLGLLVELLTNGAEHSVDILADSSETLPLMPLELCRCFIEQTSSVVFPVRCLRHYPSHSTT